jgi:hypothetical protein
LSPRLFAVQCWGRLCRVEVPQGQRSTPSGLRRANEGTAANLFRGSVPSRDENRVVFNLRESREHCIPVLARVLAAIQTTAILTLFATATETIGELCRIAHEVPVAGVGGV